MQHVYVIDDNKVVAMALSDTLQRLGYSTEVYNDPLVFFFFFIFLSPAVILIDIRMPSMSGVELQKRLLELGRKTPIIFISGEWQSSEIVMGMKQGALDFLFKPFNLDELLTVIQKALSKDLQHSLATSRQLSMRERYNSLTPREKEVCALLVAGLLSKQVAAQLGITNATIKVHKSRVLEKMQATSLQQLALAMQQLNLP